MFIGFWREKTQWHFPIQTIISPFLNTTNYFLYLSQNFRIRILTISWPWALFRLRFLIIFEIPFIWNSTVASNLHVILVRTGTSLLLLPRGHYFVKKSIRSSALNLLSAWQFCHYETLVEYKVPFYYLERSLILASTTLDLLYHLTIY